ncbi:MULTISPECIES: LLM class flavin-dependent oxidoreductase [Rhizobium]|uniref:LLM class flavin-dependent oxidoreductase n=1 Tax=Rhizobium rhododendri TaxID=2506430 RepID=A0ABY8IP76_9HYPH|nr:MULTISPECIES: LLM class flavin-dependent oxidoreductase [Rhizobium]MBO9101510.1 LLM class flavin-dependent oxidoreductase [Rhizobium sp. L58/93]MBO9134829.1 LLM class flavin-dependent oxidoreductase [Rhizobium sp. B209b/85]MBO9187503.1 LLM class flavin-dependent oxidoreductase [Rhizobium sp. E27B/91]MBZ5763212.1 LLM class flavin-dependent oxidoreductase [Rhizobium sp. VS19-DR96]MBZ5769582.1 LLM class flavin-dependent oxidoreductase [Rhizobium sp. VS19-DR129.2]
MARHDKLKLGTFVYTFGFHPAAWLHPDSDVNGANEFSHFLNIARLSEEAKFDFMFLADSAASAVGDADALARQPTKMNRFEPTSLLSALAVTTTHLGLVGTVSTSYYEPYNVARIFASIDQLSKGRACWNVVTSDHNETGYNFNREGLDPHAVRYERGTEFVDVVFGLWDSFERDALLRDRESGIYYDKDKLHTLDHKGKHFQVRGPLNIAGSPQGRPVIAQAGGSEAGMDLAARTAEVVFGLASNIDRSRAFYKNVKGRMAAYGRSEDDLKIMPGVVLNVGATMAEAQAKVDFMIDKLHPDVGRLMLSEFLEADLTGVPLDQPFPMDRLPTTPRGSKALFDELVDFVNKGHTVGELVRHYAEKHTGNGITGTPTQIADFMEEWFETRAADGFILMFPTLPSSLTDFTELVLPELRRRGLFREEYEGPTLRENLGLSMPVNRYTAARNKG